MKKTTFLALLLAGSSMGAYAQNEKKANFLHTGACRFRAAPPTP